MLLPTPTTSDRNMPEASQYMFTHKELVELMVKKAGIHEGKWAMSLLPLVSVQSISAFRRTK